ncbi:MAG TPA: ABC transporter substrate-binding protein, partial [Candidatus Udaeobacter sp.]|nr:ABC transporter substrate-binding protein [Candidatus Udaeobacter sp.]
MKIGSRQGATGNSRKLKFLLCALCAIVLALYGSAQAQPSLDKPRIGAFHLGTSKAAAAPFDAFRRGLRELGYVEGKNIIVEYRHGEGKEEKYSSVATELVALRPAVIVTWGTDVAAVVKKTTRTIPIVFALSDRPDILGLVDNLARPAGNVTGLTTLNFELSTKRLELLKESLPSLTRVGVLAMTHPLAAITLNETEATARSMGIQTQFYEIKGVSEVAGVFQQVARDAAGAVLFL